MTKDQPPMTSSTITAGRKMVINRLFATLKEMYPTFLKGQDLDRQKRLWASQLSKMSDATIEEAAGACPTRHPKYQPTIGEFLMLCREVRRPLPKTAPIGQRIEEDKNERYDARAATIRMYAHRIMGSIGSWKPVEYIGDFNCQDVADSVPTPQTSTLHEHQICWERLYKAFDQWWAQAQ